MQNRTPWIDRGLLRAFALSAVLLSGSGAHAAEPVSPMPAQQIVQAEALKGKDPVAALALTQHALDDPRIDAATRGHAIGLRCWLEVNVAIDKVPALATRDLQDAERLDEPQTISQLRACRGYAREQANDIAGAAQDYEAAVRMAQRAEDADAIAQASVLRGELRYALGDTARALIDLQLAYRLQQRLGHKHDAYYTLNAIANLYADERVGEYDKAIDYYRQVLASNQAEHDLASESTAYFNIASTLEHKGDPEAALPLYRKSLDIELKRADQREIASVRRALGSALAKLGRSDEAMPLFDQALAQYRGVPDDEGAAEVLLSRAVALRKLGKLQAANGDLDAARDYYSRHENPRYLERIESERALTASAMGNWQLAYIAISAQLKHRDTLAAQLKADTTARMRIAFDTDKTESENKALELVNAQRAQSLAAAGRIASLQRAVIALGIAIMVLLIGLVLRTLRTSRRMRALAMTDDLTQLPNRRRVFQIANDACGSARSDDAPWSLLALDIDHFKTVNDRFGHDVGDIVLMRVATACNGAVRGHDVVGRIGGEEFLVVLPRASLREACEVAERLRMAVAAIDLDDLSPGLRTTISIGVAQCEPDDTGVGDLAKRADECLYAAKAAGRNRVVSELPPV